MRRWLPLLITLSALAACEDDDGDPLAEFRDALPDEEALAIVMPGDEEVAGNTSGAGLGEPSQLRAHTARARRFLTSTISEMVASYRELVALPPIIRTADRAVWWRRNDGGAVEHLLVMTRQGEGHFTMSAWVRVGHRTDPSAPWRFLVFGDLTPARTLGDGRGALYLDLDNDNKAKTLGKLLVLFSVIDDERSMDVLTYQVATDDELAVTRGFRYRELGTSGVLSFDAGLVNIHQRPDRPEPEAVRIITRWSGPRFRSDFTATSDEIRGDGYKAIVGSECWAAGEGLVLFESLHALAPVGPPVALREPSGNIGACAGPRPAVPVLPEPTEPPSEPEPPPEAGPGFDPER
ncbi:MAG: hypothetical protein IT385_12720 [Deltaproteobacteria bacterium]|nr:hypothetical protein [Deltaproteobacteria bacterium]